MGNKILALGGSLRNARWGRGRERLIETIHSLKTLDELNLYLESQADIHLQQFIEAGRKDNLPFDQIYKNLRKIAGKNGLCNSEVGMVAALWAAKQEGCDIDYLPLASFFNPNGTRKDLEGLKKKLISVDGLLICTPVYFGNYSSLISDFIDYAVGDEEIIASLSGKPMAGIAVGAKRNGGQETALIYQLMDFVNLGMLGVGNDSDTTSQYGGTVHAGDIGTAANDDYGIKTSMGTGRRLASVIKQFHHGDIDRMRGKLKVMFWILKDKHDYALKQVKQLISQTSDQFDSQILVIKGKDVYRCIACDICPVEVGIDADYRCIIKRKTDYLNLAHGKMLDHDLIVPVAYSPLERAGLDSAFQLFIERTRYLRRGDYLFSDAVVAPLIFEEIGANENLAIRMITAMIRHHTVVSRPNIGFIHDDKFLNYEEVQQLWKHTLRNSSRLTNGRLKFEVMNATNYNPVGYILSTAKNQEESVKKRQQILHEDRHFRRLRRATRQLSG